jgi:hypothetical protein
VLNKHYAYDQRQADYMITDYMGEQGNICDGDHKLGDQAKFFVILSTDGT